MWSLDLSLFDFSKIKLENDNVFILSVGFSYSTLIISFESFSDKLSLNLSTILSKIFLPTSSNYFFIYSIGTASVISLL
jgi:hypothetical protein